MKYTFRKTLDIIILGASMLVSTLANNANAQVYNNWPKPPHGMAKVNMFISPDTTKQANEYNALKTREQRDDAIAKIDDWVKKVPYSWTNWNCNEYTRQSIINSISFRGEIYYGDRPIFGDYTGLYNKNGELEVDSLYKYKGTRNTTGIFGVPMWGLSVNDGNTIPLGHAMNAVITGDELSNPNHQNRYEPQTGEKNIQPGRWDLPNDCEQIMLYYTYIGKDIGDIHERNYHNIAVALFKTVNGKMEFVEFNPYLKDILITKRDTVAPKIEIIQTGNQNALQYKIIDDNFKSAWYSIDDGEKIAIGQEGTIQLNLDDRTRKITIGADDYFRLKGERTTYRNITGINDLVNKTLKFYPNPATSYINIELPNDVKDVTIEMHSMDGKQVFKKNYDPYDTRINVQNLKYGMYMISIQFLDETGMLRSESRKIIKLN